MSASARIRPLLFALLPAALLLLAGHAARAEDLGALAGDTGAESAGDDASMGVTDYVDVRAWLDRDAYHAGDTARIAIELKIHPRYHVNAHEPPEDFYIPTDLAWDTVPAGLKVEDIEWPKPKMAAFEFTAGEKIPVYDGTTRAFMKAVIAPGTAPGTLKLVGTFTAQGCDHVACYAPQTDEVKVNLRVVPADEETQPVNEEKFKGPTKAEGGEPEAGGPAEGSEAEAEASPAGDAGAEAGTATEAAAAAPAGGTQQARAHDPERDPGLDCAVQAGPTLADKPLGLIYLFAFGAGLLLTLTPCVLPLVPITIGYFSRQRSDGGHPLGMASLYVLGLATVYAVLGTVAALSGSLFGSALQQPAVLIGVAVVLGALALSMFGILPDLSLPNAVSSRIGGGKAGYAGAAMMGGAMGVVAAPCVGPLVVSLLTYVAQVGATVPKPQAAALGGSLFFVLALGLGVPFFLVAMGVGNIRPGEWMVTVKKVLGFVILGVALWFLRPLLGDRAFEIGLVGLLAAAAVFLLLHAPKAGKLRVAVRVAGMVAGFAALATAGLLATRTGEAAGARFQDYTSAALVAAERAERPVIVDFTAEWCTVCKEIEHRVFAKPDVQEAMTDFTLLRADLTDDKDPAVQALYKQFSIRGLPCIVFLDSEGREIEDLRLTGYESPEEFIARLECVDSHELAQR